MLGFDRGGANIYHARLMFARPLIDGADFALNGKELRGEVALDTLPRLSDRLAESGGYVAFYLRGHQMFDRLLLEIELTGKCRLRCQRCLGEMDYPIAMTSSLRLVPATEIDAADTDDETECIEAAPGMDVLSLVEDELLLGLPYAPSHTVGKCAEQLNVSKQSSSPFAVLAVLNHKQ